MTRYKNDEGINNLQELEKIKKKKPPK